MGMHISALKNPYYGNISKNFCGNAPLLYSSIVSKYEKYGQTFSHKIWRSIYFQNIVKGLKFKP